VLDRLEQRADGVDHGQQRAGGVGGHHHLAVAQAREEVLPHVRQRLEPVEGEEAAGALDGVDGPEDAGEQLAGVRRALELHEVPVELVEVLVALHEELRHDLGVVVHGSPPSCRACWAGGGRSGVDLPHRRTTREGESAATFSRISDHWSGRWSRPGHPARVATGSGHTATPVLDGGRGSR
jgi:hypothetical protein